MLTRIFNLLGNFFRKTRTIDNQPLNKVSLIVLILIDIFIIVNVFSGLADISRWHISSSEAYPCHREWASYQDQTDLDKDYQIISKNIPQKSSTLRSFAQDYRSRANDRLGKVSQICLNYAQLKDRLRNPESEKITVAIIDQTKNLSQLEETNRQIRAEYDSTLLEKIAGQATEDSINSTPAKQVKQAITRNQQKIAETKQAIATLKQQLLARIESQEFLTLLNDREQYNSLEQQLDQASFWYPVIQFGLQSLFLVPLIAFASIIHWFAQRKGYGLVALISWHLLVIFWIPLILKLFQFLQIGFLFETISNVLKTLFVNLLFFVHYFYILSIPLIGFGIIKFFQRIIFNPKVQAAKRIQKSRCFKCAKKILQIDRYCPHCGEYQYQECPNCHEYTYKFLPHCHQCGHLQEH